MDPGGLWNYCPGSRSALGTSNGFAMGELNDTSHAHVLSCFSNDGAVMDKRQIHLQGLLNSAGLFISPTNIMCVTSTFIV